MTRSPSFGSRSRPPVKSGATPRVFALAALFAALAGHSLGQCREPSLRHGVNGQLPGASGAVAVSDFNGDGRPDIASALALEGFVAVYLGRGGGSFDLSRDFGPIPFPVALVAGEFSRDGKEDLVVLHVLSDGRFVQGRVSVHLGRGDGTFDYPRAFSVGSGTYPLALVAADFDGNGDLDLAVTASNQIFVFLGRGNGEFAAPTSLPAGNLPWGLATGDFDSDGKADLVVTRVNDYGISIFLGTGSGSFTPGQDYLLERFPEEVVARDLDNDGDLDLVVNSREAVGVSVMLGDGRGNFQGKVLLPASRYPVGLVVADFDGDGHPDLALGEAYDRRRLLHFRGNGDGTFQEARVISEKYASPRVAVDLTDDGRVDLLVANSKG
ncbi:MAG: VCBS repeat-containing protein, partial [Acidobacteriota bacterium]|nr:VCBS repeat-containing protein [Acidobacteriota bacterium]